MIDLVMGYARGYTAEQLRPFMKSLRVHGFNGDVILFAEKEVKKEAKKWNVKIKPVPPLIRLPHSDRFIHIRNELKGLKNYHGILLADTRDVIFQKDITLELPSIMVNVFEEDKSKTLRSCPYNSEWLRIGYGEKVLDWLGKHPISCVGTVCGDVCSIRNYLDCLVKEIETTQPKTKKPQDQSSHNYLIRSKKVLSNIWWNEEGEIYTVGYIKRESIQIENDNIINQARRVPAVVHQADRHKNLSQLIKDLYC